MELVGLAQFLDFARLVDIGARGIHVVVAKMPRQRRGHGGGQSDRRHRALGREGGRVVHNHAAAPAVDCGLQVGNGAGGEIGVAAAGAESDDSRSGRWNWPARAGRQLAPTESPPPRVGAPPAGRAREATSSELPCRNGKQVGRDPPRSRCGRICAHLGRPFVPAEDVVDTARHRPLPGGRTRVIGLGPSPLWP